MDGVAKSAMSAKTPATQDHPSQSNFDLDFFGSVSMGWV
jgi:hypothetical protein